MILFILDMHADKLEYGLAVACPSRSHCLVQDVEEHSRGRAMGQADGVSGRWESIIRVGVCAISGFGVVVLGLLVVAVAATIRVLFDKLLVHGL